MSQTRVTLSEAAKHLRRLADDLEKGRIKSPNGTVSLPKGTTADFTLDAAELDGFRRVQVGLAVALPAQGRTGRARQALLSRSKADWAKSGAEIAVLLPAIISSARFARSLRAKNKSEGTETRL
jgi:hypothetical protein